jgi:hypothetical protein
MYRCSVAGCDRPASSQFSRHCNQHRSKVRRHGDPQQRGVTKADLQPYVAMVRRRMHANPNSPAWELMQRRWAALVTDARTRIAADQAGAARYWPNVKAAEEIVRLAEEVEPREVVETVAAMTIMLTLDPHWFRSDDAYDAQLVRRVRGLTPSAAPTYRDRAGKARRAYPALSPRVVKVMAEWLRITLGVLGQRLAVLELQEREAEAEEGAILSDALLALR